MRATGDATERILGIPFLDAPVEQAIERLRSGGLMLVPSAPTLTLLPRDVAYRSAVAACDFAIVDSAYLALLWWLIHRKRLHRVSGLEFVRAFLHETSAKQPGALFLVNPTENDGCANMNFLRSHGFELNEADCYAAPIYRSNDVADPVLLSVLSRRRPRYVMLNIGGGTQEPLGAYLKRNLEYAPGIICTGAAIAFLTGRQATIPEWVDHMGLGWLARTMGDPRRFLKRYLGSFELATLVARFGRELPPYAA